MHPMSFRPLYAAPLLLAIAFSAHAQVRIGVLASVTGPMAATGSVQKNTVPLLTARTGELTVQYIFMDDAGDPARAVAAARKLVAENNIDALIGPTGSASALGVIPVLARAGVPLLAPVAGTAVVQPMNEQKKWVFRTGQNDELIASALVENMAARKTGKLACIVSNDDYGQSWSKLMTELARKNNISVVASERFNASDKSVATQAARIMAARPDAVFIAAPGKSAALPQTTLYDQGYEGPVFQTQSATSQAFLELGGEKVEGTIVAASPMVAAPIIEDSNASKKIADEYITAYENLHGSKPDFHGASVYDAGLLLERAILSAATKARPGTRQFRQALREALEQTRDVTGTHGVYNMTPADHGGLDFRGREMITVREGEWRLLK